MLYGKILWKQYVKKEHEKANGKGPGSGGCDLHTKDVKRFAKATES